MINTKALEIWFLTGSQHLYGSDMLKQVKADSEKIVDGLNSSDLLPINIVFKPVLTTTDEISKCLAEADNRDNCIGIITWMHTFSPAKMWAKALDRLRTPMCHLHTQLNREIPWSSIDMDYMNLHQSAHGGREFGFMCSRVRMQRKVIAGHWQDNKVQQKLGWWQRAALANYDSQNMRIARLGDNMRHVAVTEGDKVEAQRVFGYSVDGYGIGDVVDHIKDVSDGAVDKLCKEYDETYVVAESLKSDGKQRQSMADAARIELGLRSFLEEGGFQGFTDTFQDLHGIKQLPGIAAQRLMADGYGFGAEGDWKHAALVRSMKVMSQGLSGGTSFMEDYTYHFSDSGDKVLGAHMLEICPSIASSANKPSCEVHPLGIGDKEDPVRLVFNSATGDAINASVVDMGNRFRMIVNTVQVVPPEADLPNLPVAQALWTPEPNLSTAAEAWIHAGGAHHTGFSLALPVEPMEDFAAMNDVEFLVIDEETRIRDFKNELRWNDAAYQVKTLGR